MKIVDFHESGPPEGGEFGSRAVLVAKDILLGFGLGFGPGMGPYKVCENFCGWSWKKSLPHDEC